MIWGSTDMRCHSDGGEEIGSSPLHIDTLKGIGIVAHPEFVEVRQHSVVGTATATGTRLNDKVWIFGTDTLAHLLKAAMILYIHVALIVFGQILGTMVHDSHIGIPFDIVYLRIRSHQIVNYTEYEVLHGRIGEVEHHLRTAASQHEVAFGSFEHPIRMLFIKLAGGVRHLRLNPDTELDAVLFGITQQTLDTVWKLILVHHPVSKR